MKISTLMILILLFYSNGNKAIEIDRNVVKLISYLPKHYVTDGSIDYTDYIQKGLDENNIVAMPNFPLLINEKGLRLKSNSQIYFQEGSVLMSKTNDLVFFATIWVTGLNNVIIHNPVIIGNRETHYGNKGEWGMGIYIDKSNYISIINARISNCWGDGIYIGGGSEPSSNVKINGANINNNRRNGITIANGENIFITNSIISNSNGTPPMAGICIEPNDKMNKIININIINVNTNSNSSYGIVVNLNKLLTNKSKNISINIDHHHDNNSRTGLSIVDLFEKNHFLEGEIRITNAEWNDNVIPSRLGEFKNGPFISLKNIKVNINDSANIEKRDEIMHMYKKRGRIKIM